METRNVALWVLAMCALQTTRVQGQRDRGLQPPQLHTNSKQVVYFWEWVNTIELECLADGTPTPTYQWNRTMEVGTPEERTEIIRPSNMFALREGNLTISNLVVIGVPKARGLYQCFASNDYGTAMSREIDVKYAFLRNFPTAAIQNMMVTEGQHVTLNCTGAPSSDPAPNYDWRKKTGVIKRTSRIAIGLDKSLHIIHIEQGDQQSAGNYYVCWLYNTQAGSSVYGASVFLNVNAGSPRNRPPTIVYHTPEVVGMLGEKAELQCIPDGNPIPDITWQNPPNGRHRVEDFTRLLSIFNLAESDEGTYTCEAKSIGGRSGRTTINLKVRSQPIWEEKPEAQIVPEGETATFRCKARGTQSDGKEVAMQWYKNGVKLRAGVNDPNIYVNGSELSVQYLEKPKHMMNIQCKVTNSYGSDIADASLTVIIPTKVLVFPQDVLLDEDNHVAEFKVNAEVDPLKSSDLKYIWKTPAGDVVTSTNSNDAIYLGFDDTLVVNTTKMSSQEYKDALGNYTCTVTVAVPRADILIYVVLTSSDPKPPSEVDTSLNSVAIAVGVSVSLLITVIVIAIVCVIRKRRKSRESRREIPKNPPENDLMLSNMMHNMYCPPPAHTADANDAPYAEVDDKDDNDAPYEEVDDRDDNDEYYEEVDDRYTDQPHRSNQNDCPGAMDDATKQESSLDRDDRDDHISTDDGC